MNQRPILRRRGGATASMLIDLVRHARHAKAWALLLVLSLALVAAAAGATTQTAVPFLVYGGL